MALDGRRASTSAMASAPTAGAARRSRAPGAGVKDVAGEDRQQRGDAAEEHGEQIERERAEHHPAGARCRRSPRKQSGVLFSRERGVRRVMEAASSDAETRYRPRIAAHPGRAEEVQRAAERGAHDACGLARRGDAGDGARDLLDGHQPGHQRCPGRILEGARGAENADKDEDALPAQPASQRAEPEGGGGEGLARSRWRRRGGGRTGRPPGRRRGSGRPWGRTGRGRRGRGRGRCP